jgi:hypothetical protein
MNPEPSSSASSTDTTSTNGHGKPNEKPKGPASEAEFLQRQADEARKALSAAFGDLSRSLRDGVDPTAWTKEHPWAMVAGAAVAGFAAAAAFVPSKEDQALRRLAKIEKALMPERSKRDGQAVDASEDGGAKDFAKGRTGFLGAIGRQVLETIKPALMSALTAGITAKAATPDNPYEAPQPPASDPYAEPAPPPDPSANI